MDEWINIIIYTYHGLLLALKKKILTHYNIDEKYIILSDLNQSQNEKYYMISLHEVGRTVKSLETQSRIVVAKGLLGGDGNHGVID
jgi:hypothetical protein